MSDCDFLVCRNDVVSEKRSRGHHRHCNSSCVTTLSFYVFDLWSNNGTLFPLRSDHESGEGAGTTNRGAEAGGRGDISSGQDNSDQDNGVWVPCWKNCMEVFTLPVNDLKVLTFSDLFTLLTYMLFVLFFHENFHSWTKSTKINVSLAAPKWFYYLFHSNLFNAKCVCST